MEENNEDNVFYCKVCLSLAVLEYDNNTLFCEKCGNSDIGEVPFEEWEKLYYKKYGEPFIKIKSKNK